MVKREIKQPSSTGGDYSQAKQELRVDALP